MANEKEETFEQMIERERAELLEDEPNGMSGTSQLARRHRKVYLAESRPSDESQTNREIEQFGESADDADGDQRFAWRAEESKEDK